MSQKKYKETHITESLENVINSVKNKELSAKQTHEKLKRNPWMIL